MNLDLFPTAQPSAPGKTGVLPDTFIRALIAQGAVKADVPVADEQVQPASLDLRLGEVAHEVHASILPAGGTVEQQLSAVRTRTFSLEHSAVLEAGKSYLIPILESLALPSHVSARSFPKSTTGRLDTVVRLLADHTREVDSVPAGFRGRLYVEVSPRSFNLVVRAGTRLTQLRFLEGFVRGSDAGLRRLSRKATLVFHRNGHPARPLISRGLQIGVNVCGGEGSPVTALQALSNPRPIDFDSRDEYDALDYWTPRKPVDGAILIEPNRFYVFSSFERLHLPANHAAVMVPVNPVIGEFLFHYAGFFDPGFGDQSGAPAALAIRSRWSAFYLPHEYALARLVYEPLIAPPARLYGGSLGSSYHSRSFPLAKQFRTGGLF